MNPMSDDFTMTTAYSAIVGDRTAWPRSGTRALAEITDGPEKTLCLLESKRYRMHWMSTADPEVEMIRPLNEAGEVLVASNHPGGVVYVRCDGNVGFLSSDTTREHLFSLINIDDDGLPAEDEVLSCRMCFCRKTRLRSDLLGAILMCRGVRQAVRCRPYSLGSVICRWQERSPDRVFC